MEEGASGEQRTQTLAHLCVKFSVQILTLAKDIELNLIFPQFCEGQLDSCFNFLREKRFALHRCLSLTMAISFKGVESPALGLLEIWLGLIFFGTAFRREMSHFINANSFPALYARHAHSQTQLPASVPLAHIMKKRWDVNASQRSTSFCVCMSQRTEARAASGHWLLLLRRQI